MRNRLIDGTILNEKYSKICIFSLKEYRNSRKHFIEILKFFWFEVSRFVLNAVLDFLPNQYMI